jgi:hypothetical protein
MKQCILVALVSIAAAGHARAIDLTPKYVTTYTDGVPISRPYFLDGKKKYAITLDGETELTSYEDSALFTFKKLPDAIMRLRQSPMKTSVPFDDLNRKRYTEAAQRLLREGSAEIVLEREESDVLPINHWTSRRFTLSYLYLNTRMKESITFLNLDAQQQIVVQIRARDRDFESATVRGFDMVRRWHEVRPESEQPIN